MNQKVELAKKSVLLLQDIDAGKTTVSLVTEWDRLGGQVEFLVDNGWRIIIFNDAGQFDYIEEIYDTSGNTISYRWMWKNSDNPLSPVQQDAKWLAAYIPKDISNWIGKARKQHA
jgi:hypothetical protein